MPLLFCDGQLIWAPGIGIDCDWQAAPGEPGIVPEWRCYPAHGGRTAGGLATIGFVMHGLPIGTRMLRRSAR